MVAEADTATKATQDSAADDEQERRGDQLGRARAGRGRLDRMIVVTVIVVRMVDR